MRTLLINTILALAFAFAVAGTATAEGSNGTQGATNALYQERSIPGESMDDFVLRVAPRAVSYTNRTSHQVCGAIVKTTDGLLQIDMHTTGNGYRCEVPSETDVYFVTHVWSRGTFSRSEREIPGYMATRNTLYFQSGGNERKVGSLGFW